MLEHKLKDPITNYSYSYLSFLSFCKILIIFYYLSENS